MLVMFKLLMGKVQLPPGAYCVVLVAVIAEKIGDCMRAMRDSGIANSGDKNQCRVITWQKTGHFSRGVNQLPFDTETYVMCVYSENKEWPSNLFKSWFGGKFDRGSPTSSVINVPSNSSKPTHLVDGKMVPVNKTCEPETLGYFFAQAFLRRSDDNAVLLPGVGAGGLARGVIYWGASVVGFDNRQCQVKYCKDW